MQPYTFFQCLFLLVLRAGKTVRETKPPLKGYVAGSATHIFYERLPYRWHNGGALQCRNENKGSKARQIRRLILFHTVHWPTMLNRLLSLWSINEKMYGFMAPTQQRAELNSLSFLLPWAAAQLKQGRYYPPLESYLVWLRHTYLCLKCVSLSLNHSGQTAHQLTPSNVRSLQSLFNTKKIKKLTKSPPSVGMRTFISEDLALTISQSKEFLLR